MEMGVKLFIESLENSLQQWEKEKAKHENMGLDYRFMVSYCNAKIETIKQHISQLHIIIEVHGNGERVVI